MRNKTYLTIGTTSKSADLRYSNETRMKSQFCPLDLYQQEMLLQAFLLKIQGIKLWFPRKFAQISNVGALWCGQDGETKHCFKSFCGGKQKQLHWVQSLKAREYFWFHIFREREGNSSASVASQGALHFDPKSLVFTEVEWGKNCC